MDDAALQRLKDKQHYLHRKDHAKWNTSSNSWEIPSTTIVGIHSPKANSSNLHGYATPQTLKRAPNKKFPSLDLYWNNTDDLSNTAKLSPLELFSKKYSTSVKKKKRKQGAKSMHRTKKIRDDIKSTKTIIRSDLLTHRITSKIRKEAEFFAPLRSIKHWNNMWVGDLTKMLNLDFIRNRLKSVDGTLYDYIIKKVESIQYAFRKYIMFKHMREKFQHLVHLRREIECCSATKLQSFWRSILGWRRFQIFLFRRNSQYATRIQKVFRG